MQKDKKNVVLPPALVWLADAPLFIDADQVGRFYDAVARPEARLGAINLELLKEHKAALEGKLNIEGTLSLENFAAQLASLFGIIKPTLKADTQAGAKRDYTNSKKTAAELIPISTPQRELITLVLHYLVDHPSRLFLPGDDSWWKPEVISALPRAIAFLDLPSFEEAQRTNRPVTKLIPTAAEFASGRIEQIYKKLGFTEKEIPEYPEAKKGETFEQLRTRRREYWKFFDENYKATKAMLAVEAAVQQGDRIRWIDYRLPISEEGDTLHLHVCPAGAYDTGVLAYNFIKRGYKHGIRLVGTLKSEPDMNVLAAYEK